MNDQLSDSTALVSPIGRGKASLPVDADQCATVLRRALHTVECRELGPEAARQRFGQLADITDGRVTVLVDEDQLPARHPNHSELHDLARAVRERGPAVGVVLVPPQPTIVFVDEMAHVIAKAVKSVFGPPLTGRTRWTYEQRQPLRPVWWAPRGEREAADEQ
ncbi:hypothetical protein [Streptomyces sp. bgisy060]|uniref:hypothetical protein n=1 Tax=Streptomyces sp. bgisy060 TaxID=3413775 RepID=UPI003EBB8B8B